MGLQKYRADISRKNEDDSVSWFARWMGGDTLSKIENCRIDGTNARRMVYVTGEPDTYFSQPAACTVKGATVRGYITSDDDGMIFHVMDSHKHLLAN